MFEQPQGPTSRLRLLARSLATFGIGTTGFVRMGLLPDVSVDLKVPISEAGLLVTAYALSLAFGFSFLAIAMARMKSEGPLRRRQVLHKVPGSVSRRKLESGIAAVLLLTIIS